MQLRMELKLAVVVLFWAPVARAEQFVLTDVTYTHSTETTNDSHYYPTLPGDTPDNWTAPVDYAHGSVHIVLDVMTKPAGGAPTKLQVCFEGTPSYACTLQSPTYTTTGRVEWDSPFSSFWYESTVDWSQGVNRMPLILKDDMNNKPHGNPSYMPTDLHVQVTLVSAGATFEPPAAGSGGNSGAGGESGAGGAGGDDEAQSGSGGAGTSGASGAGASGTGAGGAGTSGMTDNAGRGSAGMAGSPGPTAGAGGAGAQAPAGTTGSTAGAGGMPGLPASTAGNGAAAGSSGSSQGDGASGCRTAGSERGTLWPPIAAFAYLVWLGRRSARRRARASAR